jgi:hypothetical protein
MVTGATQEDLAVGARNRWIGRWLGYSWREKTSLVLSLAAKHCPLGRSSAGDGQAESPGAELRPPDPPAEDLIN